MLRLRYRGTPYRVSILPFCFVLIFIVASALRAHAAIIGNYTLNDFTLTNNNGDGSATTTNGGSTLVFTGPNNGSGLPGSTDLTAVAGMAGLIQFQYTYSTLDIWDTSDPTATPNDLAGYLLGSTFFQLADRNGQTGTASFAVSVGQIFGFRIVTADNIGEPGILTISASGGGADVPEPGTSSLLLVAGGTALAGLQVRRAVRRKENHV